MQLDGSGQKNERWYLPFHAVLHVSFSGTYVVLEVRQSSATIRVRLTRIPTPDRLTAILAVSMLSPMK